MGEEARESKGDIERERGKLKPTWRRSRERKGDGWQGRWESERWGGCGKVRGRERGGWEIYRGRQMRVRKGQRVIGWCEKLKVSEMEPWEVEWWKMEMECGKNWQGSGEMDGKTSSPLCQNSYQPLRNCYRAHITTKKSHSGVAIVTTDTHHSNQGYNCTVCPSNGYWI